MSDFYSSFEKFRKEFSKNRSLIVAAKRINSQALQDLRQDYSEILTLNALLTRLHYIAHARKDFTLEDLKIPMEGIKPLATTAACKLFVKPIHKDRYSTLMSFLRETPELFSQICYFALLMPHNEKIRFQDFKLFTEDDSIYFCFSTFPSIYNSLMTTNDQLCAARLIVNLFKLHISLHGGNFGKPHKFLSHMVSSFFLSTNPGAFFDSLKPHIKKFAQEARRVGFEYELSASNQLVRAKYWYICVNFAPSLLTRMKRSAPLMPPAARFLITELAKIDAGGFPLLEVFVFDAMFCNYMENELLFPEATLMRDVCNVIRCRYPQDIMPSPFYSMVSGDKLFDSIQIKDLIDELKIDSCESEQLSLAVQYCEEAVLITPRDLSLLFHACVLFFNFANPEKVNDFIARMKCLDAPVSDGINQFVLIKNWEANGMNTKLDLRPPRGDFDDLINCLSTIDCNNMKYSSPRELADSALIFCGASMLPQERLNVNHLPFVADKIPEALATAKKSSDDLEALSSDLFTALFSMSTEKEHNKKQSLSLLSLLMQRRVVPIMHEEFPKDFDFSSWNLILGATETFEMVLKAIELHVDTMNLPADHLALLKKTITIIYIDQLDRMHNAQSTTLKDEDLLHKHLKEYDQRIDPVSLGLTKSQIKIVNKAENLFKNINKSNPPSQNIANALIAIQLLSHFSDDVIKKAIAQARTPAACGLFVFYELSLRDDRLKNLLFSAEEKQNMDRLVRVGRQLHGELSK